MSYSMETATIFMDEVYKFTLLKKIIQPENFGKHSMYL